MSGHALVPCDECREVWTRLKDHFPFKKNEDQKRFCSACKNTLWVTYIPAPKPYVRLVIDNKLVLVRRLPSKPVLYLVKSMK